MVKIIHSDLNQINVPLTSVYFYYETLQSGQQFTVFSFILHIDGRNPFDQSRKRAPIWCKKYHVTFIAASMNLGDGGG